jgi:putative oxidoreductase
MNVFLKKVTLFFGRAALSLIFILSGVQKIFSWSGTTEATINQICVWKMYPMRIEWIQNFLDSMGGWVPLLLGVHIFLEVVGGVLVFLGIKVRVGVCFLLLALFPATLLFHNFWMLNGEEAGLQLIMFLKNLSIFGGLLILLVMGGLSNKVHD